MGYPSLNFGAEAPAHAVAMMVAANGRIEDSELHVLDELNAFRRLGVTRQRFVELARLCVRKVGAGLCERAWMCVDDLVYHDSLLNAVAREDRRLLVCRLAAAVITADGRITRDERLVYDRMLARWRISQAMVTQAILEDRVH